MKSTFHPIAFLFGAALCLAAGCAGDEPGTIKTASGVRYVDLVEGAGAPVKFGDVLVVHYTGRLTDGSVFESSRKHDKPFVFSFGFPSVIDGWTVGMVGMKVGGKRKLYIPAKMAYGVNGKPKSVPPNADLIFEVELIEIGSIDSLKANASEDEKAIGVDVAEKDRKEVTMPSGLRYTDLRLGQGATATQGKMLGVKYTGWLTTGEKFDSNADGKETFDFLLGTGAVIKGWDAGVEGMKAGGKRKLIIPPELAYGEKGFGAKIPPDSVLVFEVELVKAK